VEYGLCPAGGGHKSAGDLFVLPHRIWQDPGNDRDWRFCTKCFGLVSTKPLDRFWTVASVVVRNSEHSGLPESPSGDGLVILGYGFSDFYLGWMPLAAELRLRDTLYYAGTDQEGNPSWCPNVKNAAGLFSIRDLAPADHISMAWLKKPQSWILLYNRKPIGDQNGYIVARLGRTPWSWSQEIPIVSPTCTSELYEEAFLSKNIGYPFPYGPYILNRFTEWNATTRELGIYFLASFSQGYEVHLMHTKLSLDELNSLVDVIWFCIEIVKQSVQTA